MSKDENKKVLCDLEIDEVFDSEMVKDKSEKSKNKIRKNDVVIPTRVMYGCPGF